MFGTTQRIRWDRPFPRTGCILDAVLNIAKPPRTRKQNSAFLAKPPMPPRKQASEFLGLGLRGALGGTWRTWRERCWPPLTSEQPQEKRFLAKYPKNRQCRQGNK